MTQNALTKSPSEEVDDRRVNIDASLQDTHACKREKPKHEAFKSKALNLICFKIDNRPNLIYRKPQVATARTYNKELLRRVDDSFSKNLPYF